MARNKRGRPADRFHDGAVAGARSIIDAFPEGYFGPDKARAFYAIYLRVKATLAAVARLEDRERHRQEPSPN